MTNPARVLKRIFRSACLLAAAVSSAASAQTLSTIFSFDTSDGASPESQTLAQGRDGDLYGTALEGGSAPSFGTAFRITPQGSLGWYSFDGPHGAGPHAGLVLGIDGLLHGTTESGGVTGSGVVFSGGSQTPITVQHSFGGADGSQPETPLTVGVDGNYYGTTLTGGANNAGTIFKLTPSGNISVLYSFAAAVRPSSLVYGPDHALYGTTQVGGTGAGSIFRITPSGTFTTIYEFSSHGSQTANPYSPLLLANDGNFYGTTTGGGEFNEGAVYRLDQTGTVTVLHSFSGADGFEPLAPLIQATDGNLYGTTFRGGSTEDTGTIFSITTSGNFTNLWTFNNTEGNGILGLVEHTNGKFYGATVAGGALGQGAVFSFDVGLGPFIAFVLPYGRVGSGVQILGQGLTGTTAVTFNGVPATTFNVASDTFMGAIVPPGATTGPVQVTTPSGVLTSNVNLQVVP